MLQQHAQVHGLPVCWKLQQLEHCRFSSPVDVILHSMYNAIAYAPACAVCSCSVRRHEFLSKRCLGCLGVRTEAVGRAGARQGCGVGSSSERTRTAVTAALKKKLKDIMGDFQVLRQRLNEEYRCAAYCQGVLGSKGALKKKLKDIMGDFQVLRQRLNEEYRCGVCCQGVLGSKGALKKKLKDIMGDFQVLCQRLNQRLNQEYRRAAYCQGFLGFKGAVKKKLKDIMGDFQVLRQRLNQGVPVHCLLSRVFRV